MTVPLYFELFMYSLFLKLILSFTVWLYKNKHWKLDSFHLPELDKVAWLHLFSSLDFSIKYLFRMPHATFNFKGKLATEPAGISFKGKPTEVKCLDISGGQKTVDGVKLPWMVSKRALSALKDYEIRADDVWVTTYPKAGEITLFVFVFVSIQVDSYVVEVVLFCSVYGFVLFCFYFCVCCCCCYVATV